jgi:hypothetical protein
MVSMQAASLGAHSDEFLYRIQFNDASTSDSSQPPFPIRVRHPPSVPLSTRLQRRIVHGGNRASPATNARPSQ